MVDNEPGNFNFVSNVYGTISQSQVWYVPMISGGFRPTTGTMEAAALMATRLRVDGGWCG